MSDLQIAPSPRDVFLPGTAMGVGSLPHTDPVAAAEMVLAVHPELPAAPQLPGIEGPAGMIGQWAGGIAGVTVHPDGRLEVDGAAVADAPPVPVDFDSDAHVGLRAFLGCAAGRVETVKVQLTGPVTMGLALVDAGAPREVAFEVALAATCANAGALLRRVRSELGDVPVVAVLDEPGLVATAHPGFPLAGDTVAALLHAALGSLAGTVTGVHCCGPTDWRPVAEAGPDLLSLPVGVAALDAIPTLLRHLDHGGWIAWGAVPTTGPIGATGARLWDRLSKVWCEVVRSGCDATLLRTRAVVSPECGLALHGETQARRALELAVALGARVRDQAAATRFAMGA